MCIRDSVFRVEKRPTCRRCTICRGRCRRLARCDEEIHLHALSRARIDNKLNLTRLTERDWSERREQRRVFGLVPISRELIWDSDGEFVAAELDRLSRFEPGSEGVLRYFAPRAFKQSTPDFLRRQIHFC